MFFTLKTMTIIQLAISEVFLVFSVLRGCITSGVKADVFQRKLGLLLGSYSNSFRRLETFKTLPILKSCSSVLRLGSVVS